MMLMMMMMMMMMMILLMMMIEDPGDFLRMGFPETPNETRTQFPRMGFPGRLFLVRKAGWIFCPLTALPENHNHEWPT